MIIPVTSDGRLNKEYATCRKVLFAVVLLHYASLAALFFYLCKLFTGSHGIIPSSFFVFIKEAASVWGIWYLFHVCDTHSGLLKPLERWKCLVINRMRREEALDILRDGGRYFIDETEMALEEGFLVPKRHASKPRV